MPPLGYLFKGRHRLHDHMRPVLQRRLLRFRKVSLQIETIGNVNFSHRRGAENTEPTQRTSALPPRSLRLCGEDWLEVCKPISLNLNNSRKTDLRLMALMLLIAIALAWPNNVFAGSLGAGGSE
jgi:hypothetical protein